jgi:hypothetical protein
MADNSIVERPHAHQRYDSLTVAKQITQGTEQARLSLRGASTTGRKIGRVLTD